MPYLVLQILRIIILIGGKTIRTCLFGGAMSPLPSASMRLLGRSVTLICTLAISIYFSLYMYLKVERVVVCKEDE